MAQISKRAVANILRLIRKAETIIPAEELLAVPRKGKYVYRLPKYRSNLVCFTCGNPLSYGAGRLCRACYRQRAEERKLKALENSIQKLEKELTLLKEAKLLIKQIRKRP